MARRTFEGFPQESVCPICKTNENKECILISKDWTGSPNGWVCEAQPVHVDCMSEDGWSISRNGIIYRRV